MGFNLDYESKIKKWLTKSVKSSAKQRGLWSSFNQCCQLWLFNNGLVGQFWKFNKLIHIESCYLQQLFKLQKFWHSSWWHYFQEMCFRFCISAFVWVTEVLPWKMLKFVCCVVQLLLFFKKENGIVSMIKCIGIEPTKKIILVWSDIENLLIPLLSKSTINDT